MKITDPSAKTLNQFIRRWETLEKYVAQERSLNKLFSKVYPKNNDLNDILIKVCSLNDFYSTNIFDTHCVAKHILNLKIDRQLSRKDPALVNTVALVKMNNSQVKNFYSFASKYCSHHFPEDYPIYDSYVRKMLMFFNKRNQFKKFKSDDLKDYTFFKETIVDFQKSYNLEKFTLKQIDQYLWLVGKEHFPRK